MQWGKGFCKVMVVLTVLFSGLLFSDQVGEETRTVVSQNYQRRLPDVSYNESSDKLLAVWEEYNGSYWNIKGRNLNKDSWLVVWAQLGNISLNAIKAHRVFSLGDMR